MSRPWIYWTKGIGYSLAAIGLLIPPLAFTHSRLLIAFFVVVHLALLALGILYLVRAARGTFGARTAQWFNRRAGIKKSVDI